MNMGFTNDNEEMFRSILAFLGMVILVCLIIFVCAFTIWGLTGIIMEIRDSVKRHDSVAVGTTISQTEQLGPEGFT